MDETSPSPDGKLIANAHDVEISTTVADGGTYGAFWEVMFLPDQEWMLGADEKQSKPGIEQHEPLSPFKTDHPLPKLKSESALKQPPSAPDVSPHTSIAPLNNTPFVASCGQPIPDYDIILGEPSALTHGTRIYRRVRQDVARRRLQPSQLDDFRQQVRQVIRKEVPSIPPWIAPVFWYRVAEPQTLSMRGKLQRDSTRGYHGKSSKTFAWASDQALLDDVRNAKPIKKRKRDEFRIDRSLAFDELIVHARYTCNDWVAGDALKELCATGFISDLRGMEQQMLTSEQRKAAAQNSSKSMCVLSQKIEAHRRQQLEKRAVEAIHSAWEEMLERYTYAVSVSKGDSSATCPSPEIPSAAQPSTTVTEDDHDEAAAAA